MTLHHARTWRSAADLLLVGLLGWVATGSAIEANVPFVFPALGLMAVILGWVIMEARVIRARADNLADRAARLEERTSRFVTDAQLALHLQETRHSVYERMAEHSVKQELQVTVLQDRIRALERIADRNHGEAG